MFHLKTYWISISSEAVTWKIIVFQDLQYYAIFFIWKINGLLHPKIIYMVENYRRKIFVGYHYILTLPYVNGVKILTGLAIGKK